MTNYYADDAVTIHHGTALALPLPDASVDLAVTSPPYFGLRSYQDAGEHYAGQIGSEATPGEFLDALIAATAEMVRVLKPSGSIWMNLGDKYATQDHPNNLSAQSTLNASDARRRDRTVVNRKIRRLKYDIPAKSLMGIPWRYALRCIDDLGLILRAEVIWSKPNGLPESVTDRVRRSHEQWFHMTREPRYFSAIDEIREPIQDTSMHAASRWERSDARLSLANSGRTSSANPLGKLPGSVWTIPTEPLTVPDHLGVDHFAAFPLEWPLRIIRGWSPAGVCTACGEGRRPVVERGISYLEAHPMPHSNGRVQRAKGQKHQDWLNANPATLTGYACACPDTTAPTTPAVILDPFLGTGTTLLAAKALGRRGVGVDLSADYCRLARWRCTDPGELAKAMRVEKPPPVMDGQTDLLEALS